jgi:hypothetical protein
MMAASSHLKGGSTVSQCWTFVGSLFLTAILCGSMFAQEPATAQPNSDAEWISRDATYTASSVMYWGVLHSPLPSLLTDEGPRHFQDQFAFETKSEPSPHIVISLSGPCLMSGFYLENRKAECQDRAAGLTLWVSLDQQQWQAVWTAEKVAPEWQVQLPRPVQARYVKLGVERTTQFHLRTVKLFGRRMADEPGAAGATRPAMPSNTTQSSTTLPPASTEAAPPEATLPDAAAQAKALNLAKDIYGEEFTKAKTSQQKRALAEKLLQSAEEARDDPAAYFILLKLARDIAVLGGDVALALRAVDEMTETFRVDAYPMEVDAVLRTGKEAGPAQQHSAVVEAALRLIDEAVAKDDFDASRRLGETALASARKTGDKLLLQRVVARNKEVDEIAQTHIEIKDAIAILERTPTDPGANLAMGKYLCLTKGDWEKGIAMLALGDDEKLKAIAVQELKEPATPDEQLQVGHGWWNLAEESQKARTKQILLQRAAHWYERAIPGLTGLSRVRIEKRLEECQPRSADQHSPQAAGPAIADAPRKPKRINGLQTPSLDCTKTSYDFVIGKDFESGKSWVLSMELQILGMRPENQTFFGWGDDRNFQDVIQVYVQGTTLRAVVTDCRTAERQELVHTLGADAFGRWLKVALCFDASALKLRLLLDDMVVQESDSKVMPMPDRPMPIRIGGFQFGQRFYGYVRSCWLANTPP